MTAKEALYEAARTTLGLIVRGNAKILREARGELRDDVAIADLAILGPDNEGNTWIARKGEIRCTLDVGVR